MMTIHVRPSHIKEASENYDRNHADYCERCPVALAITEQTGDFFRVEVSTDEVSLHHGVEGVESPIRAILPQEAQDFIFQFDHSVMRAYMQPITFTFSHVPTPEAVTKAFLASLE